MPPRTAARARRISCRSWAAALPLLALLWIAPCGARAASAAEPEPTASPAESAFAEAMAAYQKKDWSAYRDGVEKTASLLHDSTRLLYRLGSARLLDGDREGAVAAFRAMVDASFYRDPREDPEYAPLLDDPRFRAELARLDALREPLERSAELFRLPAGGMLVEGVAYDATRDAWYFSSVDQRKILRRGADGAVSDFATAPELWAPLGLAVDGRARRLWVVSAGLPHARDLAPEALDRSALLAFDLDSGRRVERIDAPPGKRLWNDLELAADGTIYLSDVGTRAIVRVGRDRTVETLVEGSGLRSPGGLALSGDGRLLYVADWSQGLAVVDLATRRLAWLRAPAAASTLGADGLRWRDNALIAIQNGVQPARVSRFALAGDGRAIVGGSVLERAHAAYDEPTLGVVVDDALVYVANSHWPSFGEDGSRPADSALPPALLLRLPLDP